MMTSIATIQYRPNIPPIVELIGSLIVLMILIGVFAVFVYRLPLRKRVTQRGRKLVSSVFSKLARRPERKERHAELHRAVEQLQQELKQLESRLAPSESDNDLAALAAYREHLGHLARQAGEASAKS